MRIFKTLALLALFLFPALPGPSAKPAVLVMEEEIVLAPSQPRMWNFVRNTNPHLDKSDVTYISKVLQEKAEQYDLDLVTFAAVVAQESSFKLNLEVCHGVRGNCDIGLGQISSFWVKTWKLDKKRLQYDIAYNLDVAARILKAAYDENPTEKKAYSRYYNPIPKHRKEYEKRVEKWIQVASR